VTVYANDSANNTNSTIVSWNYRIFEKLKMFIIQQLMKQRGKTLQLTLQLMQALQQLP